MRRREVLRWSAALGIAQSARGLLGQNEDAKDPLDSEFSGGLLEEAQAGDPPSEGGVIETLTLTKATHQKSFVAGTVGEKKDAKELASKMLALSQKYADAHVDREGSPTQVGEYLRVVGLDLKDEKGVFVPYCAAGVAYAACRCYCDLVPTETYDPGFTKKRVDLFRSKLKTISSFYFLPSAAVRLIKADAEKRQTWIKSDSDPLPGWLVVFTWDPDKGVPNHVGIVESAEKAQLHTVEYNTSIVVNGDQRNGGVVARKIRPRNKTILGFVKLY